jgi:hypothetical protein
VGPPLSRQGLSGAAKGDARVDLNKQDVQMNLAGTIGESTAKARVSVANFSAPVMDFAVDVDRLDLDRYLTDVASSPRKPAALGDASLLEPLATLPGAGSVSVGVLMSGGVTAKNVRFDLR